MNLEITESYLAAQGLSPTFPQRFWSKVNKSGNPPRHLPTLGPCWNWTGFRRNQYGYGGIRADSDACRKSNNISAHRASWLLANGPIPAGQLVLHRCDNPSCVRPDHLFLGDDKTNWDDCERKGRRNTRTCETHGMAKLSWEQVKTIRRSYAGDRRVSHADLAAQYDVHATEIGNIVRNRVWRDRSYTPPPGGPRTKIPQSVASIVVHQYFSDGKTQVQIAKELGISQGAVSVIVRGHKQR